MTEPEAAQSPVVRFLAKNESLFGAVPKVIVTHVSRVFIGPARVLKLKRAVKFPFLDFRTLEARRSACEAEVSLNRRTAPTLYRGVVPVTNQNGVLAIDGDGPVLEWLVEMTRFDEATLFDRLAKEPNGLGREMMQSLAVSIAQFHEDAETRPNAGGYHGMRRIAENNQASFSAAPTGIFDLRAADALCQQTLGRIDREKEVLEDRRASGCIRACHGDLHLRNICLVDGAPTLFDAIEFSSDFSDIDILYDLAFLLMDLDFVGHRRMSNIVMNRYLDEGRAGPHVFRVLPIYLSMRAQIRAHVGASISVSPGGENAADEERQKAIDYLHLAGRYLEVGKPRLIAIGGLSGSGKSRLARELAPYVSGLLGARIFRTDAVRKNLVGVGLTETLGTEGYSPEMTARTYETFFDHATEALADGHSVILDAVFAREDQRTRAQAIAEKAGIAFDGIWVDAPEHVRMSRVAGRRNDASDATADVAQAQSSYKLGKLTWATIDSSGGKRDTLAQALALSGLDAG